MPSAIQHRTAFARKRCHASFWMLGILFTLEGLNGSVAGAPRRSDARESPEDIRLPASAAADSAFPHQRKPPIQVVPDRTNSRPVAALRLELPSVFSKKGPSSVEDLKAIERHVEVLVKRVSLATVAVRNGDSTGSGVVISEDGFILTVAHLCVEPRREVHITFPDGRRARGKTLGTNHERDAGLIQITDPGPWPHAEVADFSEARAGDWVLALGHPGGFDPQRSVVVRLGRIVSLGRGLLQSDCTISAGDSGGPLFDMSGRVIGIHSQISNSTAQNFHVPITTFLDSWDRLANGESWGEDRPAPRAWFGARGVDAPDGCRLNRVDENSPAAKAGLQLGDIVFKVNGREVREYAALRRFVTDARPGDELRLEIRRDDLIKSITVKLEARPRRPG
jgi:serine protease Do